MSEEKHMPPTQILLPEDERIINTELEQRLAHLGYAVVAMASSGAEAIERAHELCPDLVLAHIGLVRGMSGVDAAAHTWDEGKIHVVSGTVLCQGADSDPGADACARACHPQAA
jgi:CheY-like chemotaxis protein